MPKLPDDASVHERTVQAVARGELREPARRRPRTAGSRSIVSSWTRQLVDVTPELRRWLDQQQIDLRDVEVVSATEVVIRRRDRAR
jgi:hypothetical protein